MSMSFELPELDHFITGTVGEPGSRVFFIQAIAADQVYSLRLEKLQVANLAAYLTAMLADLPANPEDEIPESIDLIQPVVPEWVVGQMGVAYDEAINRVIIVAQEMPEGPETDDEPDDDDEVPRASASFHLTPGQVASFVRQAEPTVAAGRPTCMLCGRPMDPEGHVCIKTNGHKTH